MQHINVNNIPAANDNDGNNTMFKRIKKWWESLGFKPGWVSDGYHTAKFH